MLGVAPKDEGKGGTENVTSVINRTSHVQPEEEEEEEDDEGNEVRLAPTPADREKEGDKDLCGDLFTAQTSR